jgi:hypothetical protein
VAGRRRDLARNLAGELAPVAAVLGGILAGEAIKALTVRRQAARLGKGGMLLQRTTYT